jgi:hypothetical protein
MRPPKLTVLTVLVAGATALSAPSVARAASAPETFTGTIIADAAGGERHIVTSIVIAHGAFNGVGAIVEVPNQPGDGEDIFRDDLVFPEGTLHLLTTNLGFAFDVIPQSCRFTASVQQTGEIAGGTRLFRKASGNGAGGVVGRGTALRAADGSCDSFAPTLHEVDRISSTGTLSY